MSAFVVVFERTDGSVDPGLLSRVMQRLRHRGPDGSDVLLAGNMALGHWHFWTTLEEVGERQPLNLLGTPFTIVLDGRLDNRPELISELGILSSDGAQLSDAALILRAYDRWGERCLEHFVGDLAFVILDGQRGELFCARDALGERTLFYSVRGTRVVIASEPWAVAGADEIAPELNENTVSHFFALRAVQDGQTFFKNITEVLPAHGMWFTANGQRSWRYWKPDPAIRLRRCSDREYAEQFLHLLEQSIRSHLRSTTPVGILMSGGLDSGSIACLAARMIAPTPLTAISYVFDDLTVCDERSFIQLLVDQWGLRPVHIPCDDAWPFKEMERWPHNPNFPEANSYRLLKERAYQRAGEEGIRVIMSGALGDELYCGEKDWLFDLIVDGRLKEAAQELWRHIYYTGVRRTLNSSYVRRALQRLVNLVPGGRRLKRAARPPVWLQSEAAGRLHPGGDWLDPAFELKSNVLGIGVSHDSSRESINASRHALELRHPYRDRRLVEYVLSLPAYQLYNLGYFKYILRVAMQGILPGPVLSRPQSTSLSPLFMRGAELENQELQRVFRDSDAAWRDYVRADWMEQYLGEEMMPKGEGTSAGLVWLCVAYEHWFRGYF